MLIYVALSGDCCGSPFEGLFSSLDAAKARVEASGRPEAVEEWAVPEIGHLVGPVEVPNPEPLRRWNYQHIPGEKWIETKANTYRT